jgi:hypothetical protein
VWDVKVTDNEDEHDGGGGGGNKRSVGRGVLEDAVDVEYGRLPSNWTACALPILVADTARHHIHIHLFES